MKGKAMMWIAIGVFALLPLAAAAQAPASMPWKAQAEACSVSGASVMNSRAGYTGTGYVSLPPGEAELSWKIVLPKAKMYTITLRAAGVGKCGGDVYVNGEKGEKFKFEGDGAFTDIEVPNNFLDEGEATIAIRAKFSSLDVDSVGMDDGLKAPSGAVKAEPCVPDSIHEVKTVMTFLASEYGKHIVSGQMDMSWNDSVSMVDRVHDMTGKYPALQGFDFLNYVNAAEGWGGQAQVEEAIAWWKKGGLVAFNWHWRVGDSREFYTNKTAFRINLDPKSAEYKAMLADIDKVAAQLKRLEAAGVPVLWRPLHEASGAWFWWGASGPAAYKGLWNLIFDRLVNYHKIRNLIWVWNGQSMDWYPGDDTVDVIGWDIYGANRQYVTWKDTWRLANGCVKGSQAKIVALSENGVMPDPDKLVSEQVPWSWFMTWNDGTGERDADDFFSSENIQEKAFKVKVYNHPYVLTLDELPNFRAGARRDAAPELKAAVKNQILNAKEKSWKDFLDLSRYVSDEEDGNKLAFSLVDPGDGRVAEVTLSKDGKLSATAKGTGTSNLKAVATDSAGHRLELAVTLIVFDPDRGNIAFMKPVQETSVDNQDDLAKYANDGDMKTRWSSAFKDGESLVVDLQGNFKIDRVALQWEAAFGKEYEIQGSLDGRAWTTLASKADGSGGKDELSFKPATARYVKFLGKLRGTQWGFSFWEFEVYGQRVK
jgi:mannan endo-1,4-beta-mannosidase